MIISFLISVAVISSSMVGLAATSKCEVLETESSCNYTILCRYYAGSARNPSCDDEVYVTFLIEDSNKDILTPGFFGATNFDSRVREIKAKDCTWTQIGSSAFRYFARTQRMDLSGTHIRSIEKEAFRNLGALLSLNLSRNDIDTLYSESFLISESRYNNLRALDLSYNSLTELSGDVLSQLPSLVSLDLQSNKLSSIADDAFYNLKNLGMLNLRGNRLSSLNMTLVNMKVLTFLDISNNAILKLSSFGTNRLVAVVSFNASHNAIETVDSGCFENSVDLEILDLSYNKMKSDIKNDTFSKNEHLNYIDLSNNLLTHIEGSSFMQTNVSYLNLDNNLITGDIEEMTFFGLHEIKNLNLNSQNITAIRSRAFSEMNNLENLNLTRNNIKSIDDTSFINNSLTILDLSFNQISDLNFVVGNLEQLTELYLNNNNLTVLLQNTFENHEKLTKLDISMNNIVTIEEYSLPLTNLQYLYLGGNKLQGAITKNVFSPAKYLRFLDLSNFDFNSIEQMAFKDLPLVARLNLSHNAIETIQPMNFMGLDNLYSLDISFNKISNIKFNNSLNLRALYLNNNNITDINTICSNSTMLSHLDLSYNNIQDVSCIGAEAFPALSTLDLTHNSIKVFNNPQTNSLTSLKDLNLAFNELVDIDLSNYTDLVVLDVANNKIRHLNNSLFRNVSNLQALDVSNNKIDVLPPGTFKDMKSLKLVNMSSNNLSNMRFGSLRGLHKTEWLDLSWNNLSEIDVHIFHECTELRTLIVDYNHLQTLDVERLASLAQKLKVLSLGGNPILCKEIVRTVNSTHFAVQQIEVTSINKIYHEDNVHGIKCGEDYDTTTTLRPDANSEANHVLSSIVYVVISIGLLIIAVMGGLYWYRRQTMYRINFNRNSRVQLGNSVELDNSEYQDDLLN